MESPNVFAQNVERYSSQVAQDRKHNSQVKNLLYGGDAEEAPVRNSGRKALAAPGQSTASPFAVYDNANINQSAPAGKVLLPKKKEGAAKVGADGYDATALAAQKMAAAHEMEARKARNRGSGNILAQDA